MHNIGLKQITAPEHNRRTAADGATDRELNFTKRIGRHPTIRLALWRSQQGTCPICKHTLRLQNAHVHHLTYKYQCKTEWNYQLEVPDGHKRRVPPCRQCENQPQCLSRLAMLHSKCHFNLHKREKHLAALRLAAASRATKHETKQLP